MKILLIGVVINPKSVSKYKAISSATNKWQYELIKSIENCKVDISVISYVSEKSWPLGKLFPKLNKEDLDNLNVIKTFTYLNIFYLREFFIYFKIKSILKNNSENKSFDFLMTFNSLLRNNLILKFANKNTKNLTISITGDGKICKIANISIIQNYNSFLNINKNRKYFYQGGIHELKTIDDSIINYPKVIVFTGTITKLTGIDKFAMQFAKLNIEGIELHVYGRGDISNIKKLATKFNKIKVFGYVSLVELKKAMNDAFCYVNPRNEVEEFNQNTFPSKLLEYVSYGKPILSTFSTSLDTEFNKLLLLYDSDNIMSLNEQLMVIKNMNNDELTAHKNKLRLYTINNSWEKSTDSLLKYLQSFLISK